DWTSSWGPTFHALELRARDDGLGVGEAVIASLGLHRVVDNPTDGDRGRVAVWWRRVSGRDHAMLFSSVAPPAADSTPSAGLAPNRKEQDRIAGLVSFFDDDDGYVSWVAGHPRGYVL